MSATQTFTVDDTDPKIVYIGESWYPVLNDTQNEFNRSVHSANHVGDGFTYKFHGTNISVFGTITRSTKGPLNSHYFLDNGPIENYTATPDLTNDVYQACFYASPILPFGEHTLTMNIDAISPDATYHLDFLKYSIVPPNATSSETPQPSETAPPSQANLNSTGRSSPSLKVLLPAIIVPVVVFLLLLLLGVWWFVRKRNADWRQSVSDIGVKASQPRRRGRGDIEPYSQAYSEDGSRSSHGAGDVCSQEHGALVTRRPSETTHGHTSTVAFAGHATTTTLSTVPTSTSPPTTIASRILRIHSDVIPDAHLNPSPKDVPPAYSQCPSV